MSTIRDLFNVYSVADLAALLPIGPKGKPISADALDEMLEVSGTYVKIGSAKVLTERDVRDFFAFYHAVPARNQSAHLEALVAKNWPPQEQGLLVVLGNPLDGDECVYIAYAPVGGVQALLRLVAAFSPIPVAVLGIMSATAEEVQEVLDRLAPWRAKPNAADWFMRLEAVKDFMLQVQANLLSDIPDAPAHYSPASVTAIIPRPSTTGEPHG